MTLQKIEFEYDIPDGYRFVRYGEANLGDNYVENGVLRLATANVIYGNKIIVEKISEQEQPAQNPKRHKHADLIHAWAEGAKIQYFIGEWKDCQDNLPQWGINGIYRIKPKTKTIRFRNYLDRYFGIVQVVRSGVPSDLGKWLGDWQNVEIEENE